MDVDPIVNSLDTETSENELFIKLFLCSTLKDQLSCIFFLQSMGNTFVSDAQNNFFRPASELPALPAQCVSAVNIGQNPSRG